MTTYKKITLRKGKEDSLKRFHPWVFSGAIGHIDEGVEEDSESDDDSELQDLDNV